MLRLVHLQFKTKQKTGVKTIQNEELIAEL